MDKQRRSPGLKRPDGVIIIIAACVMSEATAANNNKTHTGEKTGNHA